MHASFATPQSEAFSQKFSDIDFSSRAPLGLKGSLMKAVKQLSGSKQRCPRGVPCPGPSPFWKW